MSSQSYNNGSIVNLPEDLTAEIFSWLPPKSVIMASCVCKRWRSLISSQNFISLHDKNNSGLLVSHKHGYPTMYNVTSSSVENFTSTLMIDEIDVPVASYHDLIGPLNGVIMLHELPNKVVLWNPAIREYKVVPDAPYEVGSYADFGFCFDPESNHYKVVQLLHRGETQVNIYDQGSDSWRKCNTEVLHMWSSFSDVTNSAPHRDSTFCWLTTCSAIISFDMRTEKFQYTRPPRSLIEFKGDMYQMKGDFALVHYASKARDPEYGTRFDVWVLKRFGDANTWRRAYSVGPFLGRVSSLGFWKNGELIVEHGDEGVIVHDPFSRRQMFLGPFQRQRGILQAHVFKKSLVSFEGGIKY